VLTASLDTKDTKVCKVTTEPKENKVKLELQEKWVNPVAQETVDSRVFKDLEVHQELQDLLE